MQFQPFIEGREKEFKSLLQKHRVKSLYIFGSALNEATDKAANDIDLIVEIDETDPVTKGELLIALWDKLEVFFRKKVDLLTELLSGIRSLKPRLKLPKSKSMTEEQIKFLSDITMAIEAIEECQPYYLLLITHH